MNKTELIDKIAAGAGLTKADAKKALDATVEAIKDALVAGDKVQLVGFGTSRRLRLLLRRWLSSRPVLSLLTLLNKAIL